MCQGREGGVLSVQEAGLGHRKGCAHVGGLGGGRGCSLNEMPQPCDCQTRKAGVCEAGGGACGPRWAAVHPCLVLCDSPALRLLLEGEPRGPPGTASERPPQGSWEWGTGPRNARPASSAARVALSPACDRPHEDTAGAALRGSGEWPAPQAAS